jgi:integrase/recombinase XerD
MPARIRSEAKVCRLCRARDSRHTFASDMVRAGVSLPALMQLMGHAQIQTTMVYVQVTPLEIYQQYARAVAQHIRPVPSTPS